MPTPSTEYMSMSEVGGGLGVGLVTLIGGLVLHGHFEPIKRVCDSGVGRVGQALSKSAEVHCGLDSFLAVIGTILIVGGAFILAAALLAAVVVLYTARQETSPSAAAKPSPVTGRDLSQTRADTSTAASSGD